MEEKLSILRVKTMAELVATVKFTHNGEQRSVNALYLRNEAAASFDPENFRKLRKVGKIFHPISTKSEFMVPTYEQKPQNLTTKKATTISM